MSCLMLTGLQNESIKAMISDLLDRNEHGYIAFNLGYYTGIALRNIRVGDSDMEEFRSGLEKRLGTEKDY